LVEHFVAKFNERLGVNILGVTPEAMAALMAHRWPGNIRELENLIERSVLLCENDTISLADLPGLIEDGIDSGPATDTLPDEMGLKQYVRVFTAKLERARIQRVLIEEGGNVTHASKKLGISRKSLQIKMKEYGLRDIELPHPESE
jgi:DNA-binding NtrC family response regulator